MPIFLNYFSPINCSVSFKRDFTGSILSQFVSTLAFPPISDPSKHFFLRANEAEGTVVLLADEPPFLQSQLLCLTK
jgi:hypothetical protein